MSNSLVALGYDLAVQGIPETFVLGPRRRALISSLSGMVLEIGAGTGISLRYYSPGAGVIAVDVDVASLKRLRKKAGTSQIDTTAIAADAAHLPFPDATFDALVCNLALCTITDPVGALAEARRVLKPGAPLRFLEHVRAQRPWQARGQDLLAPAWAKVAGGCRLSQDTLALIRRSGLRVERVERHPGLLLPMILVWATNPV